MRPFAFLLALTIAVLLTGVCTSGLGATTAATAARGPVAQPSTAETPPPGTTRLATTTLAGSLDTVGSGDTFGSISAKTGVSISELERLNPNVSSNSLQVGQRLRVK